MEQTRPPRVYTESLLANHPHALLLFQGYQAAEKSEEVSNLTAGKQARPNLCRELFNLLGSGVMYGDTESSTRLP